MSGNGLAVAGRVTREMVLLAILEVPGVARVGRGGGRWRTWLSGRPIRIALDGRRVTVRAWIVARPGQPLGPLAREVRAAIGGTVERLLGLEVGDVTVVVDGIGA